METSSSLVRYRRLDEASKQIRLLTLQPGDLDDDVQIQIHVASLEHNPVYEALSYVWGESTLHKTVYVDGVEHGATDNLHSALVHLRHEHEPRIMWVDAICINQRDLEERGKQVEIMGDIFSQAKQVISWLGPAADHSDDVLERLAHTDLDAMTQDITLKLRFLKLCRRSYFTRVWIVQEFCLATSEPALVCGKARLAWRAMQRFILGIIRTRMNAFLSPEVFGTYLQSLHPHEESFNRFGTTGRLFPAQQLIDLIQPLATRRLAGRIYGEYIEVFTEGLLSIKSINSLSRARARMHPRSSGKRPFHWQFTEHIGMKATDQRDKVFALLNLSTFAENSLTPDYAKSTEYILAQATAQVLDAGPRFLYSRINLGSKTSPKRPSWVPDYDTDGYRHNVLYSDSTKLSPFGETLPLAETHVADYGKFFQVDAEFRRLKVLGKHLGIVKQIEKLGADRSKREWLTNTVRLLVGKDHSLHAVLQALEPVGRPQGFSKRSVTEQSILMEYIHSSIQTPNIDEHRSRGEAELVEDIAGTSFSASLKSYFLELDNGQLCMTTADKRIRPGDHVVGLFGLNWPFMLKKTESGQWNMISVVRIGGHQYGHDRPDEKTSREEFIRLNGLEEYEIV